MDKSLHQISFDFSIEEQQPVTPPEPVADSDTTTTEPMEIEAPVTADDNTSEITTASSPVTTTATKKKTNVQAFSNGKRGRRSLKDISIVSDLIQVPADEELFKKQYYSIGEVSAMFRENQSLIRYWETEFDILQPRKNGKGDRHFRPVDVKNLVLIYDLLRRRKFTIEGAKDFLKKNKKAEEKFAMIQSLEKIKAFFLELKANL